MKNKYAIFFAVSVLFACNGNQTKQEQVPDIKDELSTQLKELVEQIPENTVPRSYPNENGEIHFVGNRDWTCGFPGGTFWFMYELTKDDYWKNAAIENTEKLDGVESVRGTHDLGFMVFCSYGNGYRLTEKEEYKQKVIQASETLIERFNPKVGCIRSWDFGSWEYPVIIDNMMNLEMLFWASKETNDPKFKNIAISHADVTLENHFRDDMSSFHVVSYDTITGEPIEKVTHQGYDDNSAWARGQSWGLYGYTLCYRETRDVKYLNAAESIADFILSNLPQDLVPYWDFNAPDIPNTNRDASAASIAASALFELSGYSSKGEIYLDAAKTMLESLSTQNYRASDGSNAGFILKHSVGHMKQNSEVDVAINYADYYYLEALIRNQNLKK